jgi:hypothetical protein
MRHSYIALAIVALGLMNGCSVTPADYLPAQKTVDSGLNRKDMSAPPFLLASWQKIAAPGAAIHVYIEGDGKAWLDRHTPSRNPTPKNPVALELARLDPYENVVYLARPCQFTDLDAPGNHCQREYWTSKRFAAEVIASYQTALDSLAQEHDNAGFHMIGYSGGANIAGLLAEQRNDILSLRTVAGNVDNDYFTQLHSVSEMPLSLNMADDAQKLSSIPQFHFIAEKDDLVPAAIYESYAKKLGTSSCLRSQIVEDTSHNQGWEEQWPTLLSLPVRCQP